LIDWLIGNYDQMRILRPVSAIITRPQGVFGFLE
jgi:hypothetical protein